MTGPTVAAAPGAGPRSAVDAATRGALGWLGLREACLRQLEAMVAALPGHAGVEVLEPTPQLHRLRTKRAAMASFVLDPLDATSRS